MLQKLATAVYVTEKLTETRKKYYGCYEKNISIYLIHSFLRILILFTGGGLQIVRGQEEDDGWKTSRQVKVYL